MRIMLSKHQQKNVWDGWLDSETRAHYFAQLCVSYHQTQRWITWATLLASSGATAAILAGLSPAWSWLRLVLVLASTALSLWLLVSNYNKNATECCRLNLRWNRLAIDYETLWTNMYSPKAHERLEELRLRNADLSEPAPTLPYNKKLMREAQEYTLRFHPPHQATT
jgi:hypothetical protein